MPHRRPGDRRLCHLCLLWMEWLESAPCTPAALRSPAGPQLWRALQSKIAYRNDCSVDG